MQRMSALTTIILRKRKVLTTLIIVALFCFVIHILSSSFFTPLPKYDKTMMDLDEVKMGLDRGKQEIIQVKRPAAVRERGKKLILFYTDLWLKRYWNGFETTDKFVNWGGYACKQQNCEVTYDRELVGRADVVIFHCFDVDMNRISASELQKISAKRHMNQAWVYFIHESPLNANPKPELFNGFFNWTMSYKQDADITVPYNWELGTWEEIPDDEAKNPARDYTTGKTKLAYAIISHCGLLRDKYIKKLQTYIDIDVYGKCSKQFHEVPKVCIRGSQSCKKIRKQYKFFLAFENSFCVDYITEKFYKTLIDGDSVPVVMGGADYNRLTIKKSFIDIFDFEHVEGLVNFLKFLDQNADAYNAYHKWKQNYRLGKPRAWSCDICEMANEKPMLRKNYKDLGSWYSVRNNCGSKVEKLKTIMKNSNIKGPYVDQYNH